LRLRVAIHTGPLHRDGGGWAGAPLVACRRMLDAAPVRRVLAADDHADLVVVVSEAVYDGVVRHGAGLDPATFHPVDIVEKELTARVWVHVPGYQTPPGLRAGLRGAAPVRSSGGRSGPVGWIRRHKIAVSALVAVVAVGLAATVALAGNHGRR